VPEEDVSVGHSYIWVVGKCYGGHLDQMSNSKKGASKGECQNALFGCCFVLVIESRNLTENGNAGQASKQSVTLHVDFKARVTHVNGATMCFALLPLHRKEESRAPISRSPSRVWMLIVSHVCLHQAIICSNLISQDGGCPRCKGSRLEA